MKLEKSSSEKTSNATTSDISNPSLKPKEDSTNNNNNNNSGSSSCSSSNNNKEPAEGKKTSLIEKLKITVKDNKHLILKTNNINNNNDSETHINSNIASHETSEIVPEIIETDKIVPKLLGSKFEVPKIKNRWELLKKSSLTSSKCGKKYGTGGKNMVRKVVKKGTYLSKSDTVLEKQKTFDSDEYTQSENDESPNNENNNNLNILNNEETVKRVECDPETENDQRLNINNNTNNYQSSNESDNIKKYNSISDLSPEYSGLPFVKKLKILNERQKLAELEKELIVRSASLDVPDHHHHHLNSQKKKGILTRSQSEAITVGHLYDRSTTTTTTTTLYRKTSDFNKCTNQDSILSLENDVDLEKDAKIR